MKLLLAILLIFSFLGCSGKKPNNYNVFKTKDANNVENDYIQSLSLVLKYKYKLDKRNPSCYNKKVSKRIVEHIKASEDIIYLYNKNTKLTKYQDYLNLAFNTEKKIKHRNDYLILGLYKLLYSAYSAENFKVTALGYNMEEIKKAHKNLQILQWKIKHTKDKDGKYLFLTWQNNWQIELLKKYHKTNKIDYNGIKNLHYIKNGRESIFDPSNTSYELIIDKILFLLEDSVSKTDMNAGELFVEVVKASTMFI